MSRNRLIISTAVVAAAMLGVGVAPASAVPSCVKVTSSSSGVVTVKAVWKATNTCGKVVSGRWSITRFTASGATNGYTDCVTLSTRRTASTSITATYYPLTDTGLVVNKFVDC